MTELLVAILILTILLWVTIAGLLYRRLANLRALAQEQMTEIQRWQAAYADKDHAAMLIWPDGAIWDADGLFARLLGRRLRDASDLPADLFNAIETAFSDPDALPATVALESGGIANLKLIPGGGPDMPIQVQMATAIRPPANLSPEHLDIAIFESCPLPMWVLDANLTILAVNRAYAEAVEKPSANVVLAEQLGLLESDLGNAVAEVMRTGSTLRERRVAIVAGQRRNVAVTLSLLTKGQVLVTAVDVTGEEEALGELAHVLDAQSETLDRLRTPVAIFGANKSLQFYNSAFRTLVGLSEAQLDNITHEALLDAMYTGRRVPEQVDFQAWKRDQLDKYTNLIEAQEEMWYLADGSSHRAVTQPYPFGGLLLLIEDVTDRLELERSYNTLVEVQRETLDNMAEGVAVFEEDGRLSLFNAAFVDLWSLDIDSMSFAPKIGDLVKQISLNTSGPAHDGEEFRDQLAAWVSERLSRKGRWIRGDGRIIDFRLVPLPDGGTMLTQTDVTDSARIEQALRERSYALEAADRIRSEFIANMSYEFRTPLNSIMGFGEILQTGLSGPLEPRQKAYVDNILTSASALRDMITDVLDLAAIESGDLELNLDMIDINALIEEVLPRLDKLLDSKKARFAYQPGDYGRVVGDKQRLIQAINNMVSSIVGLIPDASLLSMSVEVKDMQSFISIDADRCGTIDHDRDEIVTLLKRGQIPERQRNSGLNLALARSIVTLHGGGLEVMAVGDAGICLRMELVRQNPAAVA